VLGRNALIASKTFSRRHARDQDYSNRGSDRESLLGVVDDVLTFVKAYSTLDSLLVH